VRKLRDVSRVVALLCVVFVAGCSGARRVSQDAAPAPSRPEPRADEEPDRGIDPRRFGPYFEGDRGGAAVTLLNRAEYPEARAAFLSLAKSLPDDSVLVPRARFIAAVCAHRSGEHAAALAELPLLGERLPMVRDQALYMASVSAYREEEFERSHDLAQKVSPRSPLRPDADLVAGDALRALARHDAVERLYRAYVYRRRGGARFSEATFKLGEAVERQISGAGDLARVRESIRWYRRVTYRHPRSRWAREASKRIGALSKRLPEPERAEAAKLTADEQLERAESYARAQRHKQAMREFEKVLGMTDPDGPIGCQARLGLGRAAYNGRKRNLAAKVLVEAADHCDEPDIRAWSLYLAGRSHSARGRDRGAADVYQALEESYPEHRLADDARLRRAQALLRLGEEAAAEELLREMPSDYPRGDMRCEGVWHLGWSAYRDGELERSLAIFRTAVDLCDSPAEGAHGRELYWAARVLERLGQRDEAVAAYQAVVEGSPLTYYMFMALGRLDGLDREAAERVRAAVGRPPEGDEGRPWRLDPRALKQRPGLVRGIELLRLNLESLARIELGAARAGVGQDDDLLWLVAALHHRAGDYPQSVTIARRQLTGWRGGYPVGSNRRHWLIGYPRGFDELVEREAAANGIEPELMWAVMREESSFSPRVESFANAVGLLQLLPTTAARFAKGLRADREGLREPENNVPIAARYLAWLLARNDGAALLTIASYNAGEGAVRRWRRAEPDLELDEALESFSYDETRRYTRRVLTSYGTYHYLYGDGRIPSFTGRRATRAPTPSPAPWAAEGASCTSG